MKERFGFEWSDIPLSEYVATGIWLLVMLSYGVVLPALYHGAR